MSAAQHKPVAEMTPVVPFSYAQAAKGRSPSLSAYSPSSKTQSDGTDTAPQAKTLNEQSTSSGELKIEAQPRKASESYVGCGIDISKGPEDSKASAKITRDTPSGVIVSQLSRSETHGQNNLNPPASPSFGTASTSTLPKEDDLFAAQNDSSDSTWEKNSQDSLNEVRAVEKPESEKDSNSNPPWDQKGPVPAPFKEAPLPAQNVWQQRMLEHKAKTGSDPKFSHNANPSKTNNNGGLAGAPRKVQDDVSDFNRQENKKKAKTSPHMTFEKSSAAFIKDIIRPGDGKYRNLDEGMVKCVIIERDSAKNGKIEKGTQRAIRSAEATGAPAVMPAPPPPPGDAISWPTFESLQDEKRKTQDRTDKLERTDKDKSSSSKAHGKEKWVTVPYVPTAIFETPLPQARRGGRPVRGSREHGPRGGHAAHGSIGGEKQSNNFSTMAVPSFTAVVERSKGEMAPPSKISSYTPKPKRSASAGPPTSREQRSAVDSNLQEEHTEVPTRAEKESNNSGATPIAGRRASTATQTDHSLNGRRSSQIAGKDDSQGPRKKWQNGTEKEDRQQSLPRDFHTHPRQFGVERRSEGSVRPPDNYVKESNGFLNHRDRGEIRGERARGGGFRGGRSSNGNYSGNHSTGSPAFANGHSSHQSPMSFPPSKTNSFIERHTPPPQSAPFPQTQQSPRNYRGGPRSQSIPNSTAYGRYQNGAPPGTHHLPTLQTDVANMYGYQNGHQGIMSAMPYHPYVEQIALLGMVQMQM